MNEIKGSLGCYGNNYDDDFFLIVMFYLRTVSEFISCDSH